MDETHICYLRWVQWTYLFLSWRASGKFWILTHSSKAGICTTWNLEMEKQSNICLKINADKSDELPLAELWNVVFSLFLLGAAAAGPGGPGARRFPPSVCLREAEGAADPDGRPRLRRPDGARGHRACQAAPGVPPGVLNHISSDIFIQCYLPSPIFEHVLKSFKVPRVWTPSWNSSIFCLYSALSIFLV